MDFVKNVQIDKQLDLRKLFQLGAKKVMSESKTDWFTEKQLHKLIFQEVQKMKDHDVKQVKLNSRLFLIHRLSYREKIIKPFEHVYNNINLQLKNQQADVEWQKYLQKIKKQLRFP